MEFIKKHRLILSAAIVVVIVLTAAWIIGGNRGEAVASEAADTVATDAVTDGETIADPDATEAPESVTEAAVEPIPSEIPETVQEPDPLLPDNADTDAESEAPEITPEPEDESVPEPTPEPETPAPTQVINPETGRDKYATDPVPEGKPAPVEPQDISLGDGTFTVTLSVRCDVILDNMDDLTKDKHELVPDDGVLLAEITATVNEGESVFNVLQREMRRAGIHMEFVNTPIYNSAYIEGIGNLYEFDVGPHSGWMYRVNGWFPNYGCSRYQLQPGDVIEWIYTCDLGRDIGGSNAIG